MVAPGEAPDAMVNMCLWPSILLQLSNIATIVYCVPHFGVCLILTLTGGQLEKRRRQPTTKEAASEGRLLGSAFGVQVVCCWCWLVFINIVRTCILFKMTGDKHAKVLQPLHSGSGPWMMGAPVTDNWVSPWLSRHPNSQYSPTGSTRFDVRGGISPTTRPTCYVSKHTMVYDEGE